MREYDLLELSESLQLVQVLMVHNQVKPNVSQMHLLHLVVELRSLKHFKRISEDVEDLVRLDLSMATLH